MASLRRIIERNATTVAAVTTLVAIVFVDIVVDSSVVLIPMLFACPLIAASGGPVRHTVAVGVASSLVAAVLGFVDDLPGPRQIVLTLTVVVGGVLAWRIAVVRIEREQQVVGHEPALEREHGARVRAEYLASVHDVLSRSSDVDEIATAVAAAAVPELADWSSVVVSVDRPRAAPLIAVVHNDPAMVRWADDVVHLYPYDPDAAFGAAKVIRTGERDLATDVSKILAALPENVREVLARADIEHVLTVPIVGPLGVLGSAQLIRGHERQPFTDDEIELVEELAARSGAALNTAVLLARQVSSAEALETLQRVSGWLARAATVQDVVNAVVMHGSAGLRADGAFVFATDGETLEMLGSTGLSEADHSSWVRTLAKRTIDEDAVLRERVGGGASGTVLREVLLTPLRLFDKVVGVVGFAFPSDARVTTEQVAMVASLASRCAGAIERARLYERERNAALMLQHRLLPQIPVVPDWLEVAARYEPAPGGEVGGDWFHVLELADGHVAVSVGDAVGHGITSAAAMGQLRASISTAVSFDGDPGAALAMVDRFAEQGSGTMAATAAVAVVDVCGLLRLASAGHPPPLLVRADRTVETLLGGRRPVLGFGLGPDPAVKAVVVPFEPGDTLLMFSDGLVERRGEMIDVGLGRLGELAAELCDLSPQALCDRLVVELREFTSTDDDVVLLVVRRR